MNLYNGSSDMDFQAPAASPGVQMTPGAGELNTSAITSPLDPSQSTLSPNFASYVYNMLGKGEAAANLPYQPFEGQRFAGPSQLQQQAFGGLGSLTMPSQFGTATNFLTQAGQRAGEAGSYTPGTFGNMFQAPASYQPGQIQSNFNYQPGQIQTGLGPVGSVESYMSPYLSGVLDPALKEARRQADISATSRGAKYAQAGAFGGARQAIENAEAERNLQQQLGTITSTGLQGAYDRALAQRAQEAGLGLTAQQASEQAKQFGAERGASLGLQAQQLGEQSRQFGAQQGMQGAQLGAQYGLEGARLGEQSRQFGAQQGMQGIGQMLGAGQALGGLGAQQYQTQLGGLQALLGAGGIQQQLAQQPLDFGYQQWQESMKYPFQQASYMQSLLQGLPLGARPYETGVSGLASAMQGGLSGLMLYNLLQGKP